MNVLFACDGLDAVVVRFDAAFVEWLLDRHHDLLRCAVTLRWQPMSRRM